MTTDRSDLGFAHRYVPAPVPIQGTGQRPTKGGPTLLLHWEHNGHALIPAEVTAAQQWLRGAPVPPM